MINNFLYTKIIPEHLQENIISRKKLVKMLETNVNKTLIVICGKGGYGKTTLVKELMNNLNRKFAWYKIDKNDNDFFKFLSYLINSISLTIESFGLKTSEILTLINSEKKDILIDNSTIIDVITSLLNEIALHKEKNITLVLDDFHLISDSEWVSESFTYLLENAPENFHVIITSREEVPFKTTKLKVKRNFFELKSTDLVFDDKEVKQLVNNIYKKDLTNEEINYINKKFKGWITGLHLYMQVPNNNINKVSNSKLSEALFDYFTEDIFSSLDDELKNFLIATSLFYEFTVEQCDFILKSTNSKKFLDILLRKNIFLQTTSVTLNNKSILLYQYDDTFREFLIKKFEHEKSDKEKKNIYLSIANYFLYIESFGEAIINYIKAEEYEKAQILFLKHSYNLWKNGNFIILNKIVNIFPHSIVDLNPYVKFYHLRLDSYFNKSSSKNILPTKELLSLFKRKKDIKYLYETTIFLYRELVNLGKYDDAIKLLQNFLKEKYSSYTHLILSRLTIAYCHQNKLSEAYKNIMQVLKIAEIKNDLEVILDSYMVLAWISGIKGHLDSVIVYSQKVLNETTFIPHKIFSLRNLINALCIQGNFSEAKEHLAEINKITKNFNTVTTRINNIFCNFYYYFSIGNYEKIMDMFKDYWDTIEKSAPKDMAGEIYSVIIQSLTFRKDFKKLDDKFEFVKNFGLNITSVNKSHFQLLEILFKAFTGKENFNRSINKLLKLYSDYDKNNMLIELAEVCYYIAYFYFKNDNIKEASNYLERSLTIAIENKYISFYQRQILFDRSLFDFAIERNIHSEFIHYLGKKTVMDIENEFQSNTSYRKLRNNINTLYDISVSTLGSFTIKIRGKLITDDKWKRKIRKVIFTFIFLNRNNNLNKDKILDIIYPDELPDNFDNIFYQTITTFRSVLRSPFQNLEKNKNLIIPTYLNYIDKNIWLNPGYLYYSDVEEFKYLSDSAFSEDTSIEQKISYLEKAISLYKGDFLEEYIDEWIVNLREKYLNIYEKNLISLIEILKNRNEFRDVIFYSEKLLKIDNLREESYLDIIKSELKLENISNAKECFRKMLITFEKEINAKPSKSTLNQIKDLLLEKEIL